MYLFFGPNQEFPTNEQVAQHFQEVFWLYAQDPDLVHHFHSKVLVPFGKAYHKYLDRYEEQPYNPFTGGIFTKINGISIWDLLLEWNHIPTFKFLLALMVRWGFASHSDYGWTIEQGEALHEIFHNNGIFEVVKRYDF